MCGTGLERLHIGHELQECSERQFLFDSPLFVSLPFYMQPKAMTMTECLWAWSSSYMQKTVVLEIHILGIRKPPFATLGPPPPASGYSFRAGPGLLLEMPWPCYLQSASLANRILPPFRESFLYTLAPTLFRCTQFCREQTRNATCG